MAIKYLLLLINVVSFLIYAWDKYAAIKNRYRISEKNLLLLVLLFGAPGAFLSMKLFHHKTQKPKFVLLVPILMALQLVIISLLLYKEEGYNILH